MLKGGGSNRVEWTTECQSNLDCIVSHLTSHPILILPDFTEQFILRTDASDAGLGACLLQLREDILHPVTFVSRKLLPRERKYAILERECLAVVWAVGKLSRYLTFSKFVLESDAKPLRFLAERRSTSARLTRWALALQPYCFDVRHIAGSQNCIADLLSRNFEVETEAV